MLRLKGGDAPKSRLQVRPGCRRPKRSTPDTDSAALQKIKDALFPVEVRLVRLF